MIPIGVVSSSMPFGRVPDAPVLSGSFNSTDGEFNYYDVSWTVPANNGSPITNFANQFSNDGVNFTTSYTGSSTYTSDGVGAGIGEVFYIRVYAINSFGNGTPSNSFVFYGP
jgi:hypothetical protein